MGLCISPRRWRRNRALRATESIGTGGMKQANKDRKKREAKANKPKLSAKEKKEKKKKKLEGRS